MYFYLVTFFYIYSFIYFCLIVNEVTAPVMTYKICFFTNKSFFVFYQLRSLDSGWYEQVGNLVNSGKLLKRADSPTAAPQTKLAMLSVELNLIQKHIKAQKVILLLKCYLISVSRSQWHIIYVQTWCRWHGSGTVVLCYQGGKHIQVGETSKRKAVRFKNSLKFGKAISEQKLIYSEIVRTL